MLGAVDVFLLAVAFTSDVYQSETNCRRHFVDVFLPPPNRNRQERLSTLTQKKSTSCLFRWNLPRSSPHKNPVMDVNSFENRSLIIFHILALFIMFTMTLIRNTTAIDIERWANCERETCYESLTSL